MSRRNEKNYGKYLKNSKDFKLFAKYQKLICDISWEMI